MKFLPRRSGPAAHDHLLPSKITSHTSRDTPDRPGASFAPPPTTATSGSVAVSLGEAAADFTFGGSQVAGKVTCGTPSPRVYLVANPVT
jgi:hypothetical protein